MHFTFAHNNLNVYDLDKSLEFYKEALGLSVTRTTDADDGSFKLVYLGDGTTPHLLELTWLRYISAFPLSPFGSFKNPLQTFFPKVRRGILS